MGVKVFFFTWVPARQAARRDGKKKLTPLNVFSIEKCRQDVYNSIG